VAPHIEDCIIIIGINLGELFGCLELVLDDRVLKEFGNVVLERLEAAIVSKMTDNTMILGTHLDTVFIHRRVRTLRRSKVDCEMG